MPSKETHYELFQENNESARCTTNPDMEIEILRTSENNNNVDDRIKTSLNRKKTIFLFEDNKQKYKEDLNKLDKKMDNIQDSIKSEFLNQAKNFAEIKKKKLQKMNSKKSKFFIY